MQRNLGAILLALVAATASVRMMSPGGPSGSGKGEAGGAEAKASPPASGPECRCMEQPRRTLLDAVGLEYTEKGSLSNLGTKAHSTRCLVVTLADPISSRLASDFDQTLASLQLTASALGFHLDRFWLPWERRPWESDACANRCRVRPGMVLFSREAPRTNGPGGERDLLVGILAGEIPTSGLARRQFAEAIQLAAEIPGCRDPKGRIPILGPAFSGSIQGLAEELAAEPPAGSTGFRVITPSATWAQLADFFGPDAGGKPSRVDFGTTVHSDDVVLESFGRFVRARLGLMPEQVAAIVEGNTAYGTSLLGEGRKSSAWIGWEFPVPMRVSDMRRESTKGRGQRQSVAVGGLELPGALGLRSDDAERPRDSLPVRSRTTVNYTEQALMEIVGTIVRERIRLVGILTTDIQDKIFLAELLRQHAPDVQLFTVGADVLLAYPDTQRALYGSLVVSSYPVLLDAQGWGPPFPKVLVRPQFTSEYSIAAYNGILHLLDGRADRQGGLGSAEPFIGLQCPFAYLQSSSGGEPPPGWTGRPAIWISAVGKDALWPVAAECRPPEEVPGRSGHAIVAGPLNPGIPSAIATLWPGRQARLLLLALSGYALWEWAARRRARGAGAGEHRGRSRSRLLTWSEEPYRPTHVREVEKSRWLLLAQATILASLLVGWLLVASLEWSYLAALWRAARGGPWADPLETALGLLSFLAGAVGAGAALANLGWSLQGVRRRGDAGGALATVRALLALTAAVILLLAAWTLGRAADLSTGALLAFHRVQNLSSGLSPALPFAALAAGLYVTLRLELRRYRLLDAHLLEKGAGPDLLARYAEKLPALSAFDRRLRIALGDFSVDRHGLKERLLIWGIPVSLSAVLWGVLERTDARSLDGPVHTHLFVAGFCGLFLAAAIGTLRAARLWSFARLAFEALGRSQHRGAFARMKEEMPFGLSRRFLLFRPDLHDLGFLVELHGRWARAEGRAAEAESLEGRYTREVTTWQFEGGDPDPWRSGTYERMLDGVSAAQATLAAPASGAPGPAAVAAGDFLAAHVAFAVSWVIAHLRLLLISGAIASVALLAAATVYPFEPRRLFASALWVILLVTAATATRIYFQLERNALVSWFTRTDPGSLSLQSGFVFQVLGVVGLPLLALLAVEFPEVAQFFSGWLEPVTKAMR